jgi:hypothetical protein
MSTKHKDFCWLYLYEGCSKHGCKIGVCYEHGLDGRLKNCRNVCKSSSGQFVKTWRLANAYQIEQFVVQIFSERRAGRGEEWFAVPLAEMLDAVDFALDWHSPDYRERPRRFRIVCGHISRAEA